MIEKRGRSARRGTKGRGIIAASALDPGTHCACSKRHISKIQGGPADHRWRIRAASDLSPHAASRPRTTAQIRVASGDDVADMAARSCKGVQQLAWCEADGLRVNAQACSVVCNPAGGNLDAAGRCRDGAFLFRSVFGPKRISPRTIIRLPAEIRRC